MALLEFPNPVNEKAARTVAGGVVVLTALALVTGWAWLIAVLAIGFFARVLAGPRFSLLGRLATEVIAPRLGEPRPVPGPPKRFAQGIGLVFTTAATALAYAGQGLAAGVLLAVLLVFAVLESVVGFCAGCWMFGLLMRAGVIPEETCAACATWTPRSPDAAPATSRR